MHALPPLPDAYPAQPNDPNVTVPLSAAPTHTVNDVIEPMEQMSIAEHSDGDYNLALHEDGATTQAAAAAPLWFQSATQLLQNDIRNDFRQLLQQLRNDIRNDFQQLRLGNEFQQIHEDFPSQQFSNNSQQYYNQQLVQKLHRDIQNDVRTMMRTEYLPDQKRLMNHNWGNGACGVPFEVVPFNNGDDPTKPPHNLPPLRNIYVINDLNEQQLFAYLAGYGTDPLQVPDNRRKDTLGRLIGSTSKVTERAKRYDTR